MLFAQSIPMDGTFENWRERARELVAGRVEPSKIEWNDAGHEGCGLFGGEAFMPSPVRAAGSIRVPAEFMKLARSVACFRDENRWMLLYRVLFRLVWGEAHLLKVIVDDDVHRLTRMEKAVRRDAHKMRAFVRFREAKNVEGASHFVAFHRPDHYVLPLVKDFFVDRFHDMRWTILTPDRSMTWDGSAFFYHAGEGKGVAADKMESFWKTYYANIFNPARVRVKALVKEMPTRHWKTLPEAELIPELLRNAPKRMEEMIIKTREAGRAAISLSQLREAAASCRGCGICEHATQTVFGEGPTDAKLMIVGEQPGDQEDLAGRPFVGPAGQLLMEAMERVGLRREEISVTNAVKHFKWEAAPRGKRRIHRKPAYEEVTACRPWLMGEVELLKPRMIVGLGVTAGQSLLGPDFRLTPNRGRVFTESGHADWLMVTIHPSALLRIPDAGLRAREMEMFEQDLRRVKEEMGVPGI